MKQSLKEINKNEKTKANNKTINQVVDKQRQSHKNLCR